MQKISNYNYETKLKKCTQCGGEKELTYYGQYKNKTTKKLYYSSQCKRCKNKNKTLKWNTPEYKEKQEIKYKRIALRLKLSRESDNKTYQQYLEECREKRIKVKELNPELYYRKQKDTYLRSKYGITIEDYEQMSENQINKCLICKNEYPLVVDHCHTSEKVRGLLCSECNSGLGLFKENPDYLLGAIEYIKSWSE